MVCSFWGISEGIQRPGTKVVTKVTQYLPELLFILFLLLFICWSETQETIIKARIIKSQSGKGFQNHPTFSLYK